MERSAFQPTSAQRRDEILLGGSEPGTITIAAYDPAWPSRFEGERRRIDAALGTQARLIEHIGSTAVPDLAAKPIVDIAVAVDDVDEEARYRPQLEMAGYALRVREPGHRMFRTLGKDVHVHVWDAAAEIQRHLAFRDWLRASEPDRQLYEQTKRDLATKTWTDTNEYAEAKSSVIAEILGRAPLGFCDRP